MARLARCMVWLATVVVLPFLGSAIPSAPRIFHPVTSDEIDELLTLCFADVYQGVYSLARSLTGIKEAIMVCKDKGTSPDANMACAGSILDIFSDMSEAVSYLSATASDCVSSLSDKAYCSGDISAMVASVFDVANFVTDVNSTCTEASNGGRRLSDHHHGRTLLGQTQPVRKVDQLLPKIDAPRQSSVEKRSFNEVLASMEFKEEALNATLRSLDDNQMSERGVDVAFCIFDLNQGLGSLIRSGVAIKEAIKFCTPEKQKKKRGQIVCTVDIMGIIGSFAMAAEFLSETASHCPFGDNPMAECVGDIMELTTAVTSIIAASVAMPLTCRAGEMGFDEGVAPDRRLLAGANRSGATFV